MTRELSHVSERHSIRFVDDDDNCGVRLTELVTAAGAALPLAPAAFIAVDNRPVRMVERFDDGFAWAPAGAGGGSPGGARDGPGHIGGSPGAGERSAGEATGSPYGAGDPPVRGEIRLSAAADGSHIVVRVSVRSEADRTVTLTVPRMRFAASPSTRYLDPNTGGSLRPRTNAFRSVYPGGASICATFAAEPVAAGADGAEPERAPATGGTAETSVTGEPGGTGLGFGFFNEAQRRIELENGPEPESALMAATFRRLYLPAGVDVELPAFYLTTASHWDAALAPYRAWARRTWPLRDDTPDWVTKRNWLFHTVLTNEENDPSEEAIARSIVDHVKLCRKLGTEPVIWIQNWWRSCDLIHGRFGFDHVQGDFDRARPKAELAVRRAKELGARVCVYVNVTAIGEYSEFFHEAGDVLLQNEHGGPVRNWAFPMMMLCPGARQTKEYWNRIVRYLFGELGIDAIFLDQAGAGHEAPYCYHPAHGHDDPDCYGRGMLELLESIRSTVQTIKADALVFAELAHDARTPYVDFWLWHWFFSGLDREIDTYAEALVWMKYVRPDAVFVEQEPGHASPEVHARRVLGRGIWLNPHYPGQEIEPYHLACWESYRAEHRLFEGEVYRLECDDPEVSAVCFGGPAERSMAERDPAEGGPTVDRAIVGLMRPGALSERASGRRVSIGGLPVRAGESLSVRTLPGGEQIAAVQHFDPKQDLTLPMPEVAETYLIEVAD